MTIRVFEMAPPAKRGASNDRDDIAKIMPILLLLASNVFMTFAWYGHLKFKAAPLYALSFFRGASPSSNTG